MDGSGTRTWEIHDALGSVRQHLAADGSVLPGGSYAYTPFGVVAGGNTPAPFGFTGELHSQGLVYLRARWYDPSSGAFTSRDPFAGFPTMPYSLHPYQYGYSNPFMYHDATGRQSDKFREVCGETWEPTDPPECGRFGHGLVSRLKDEIWDVAHHYAQFTPPEWDADTLAILMAAILIHENSYNEAINADPTISTEDGGVGPFFGRFPPGLSQRELGDTYIPFKRYNPSTGIANLRPGVLEEMMICREIPTKEGGTIPMDFPPMQSYEIVWYYNLAQQWVFKEHYKTQRLYDLLQDESASLDFLGANLVRGIRRAEAEGVRPSIVNIAVWHNSGVVNYNRFDGGHADYVKGIMLQLGASASILSANFIQPEDPSNPYVLFSERGEFEIELIKKTACSLRMVANEDIECK